jgi:hypothetical protein
METYTLTSAQENLTGEYRQVAYINVEDDAARMNQIWMLLFIASMTGIAALYLARSFGKLPAGFTIGAFEIVLGIIVILGTLVAQGWMYGLVLRHYGARPRFGLFRNNVMAYISVPGYGLRRNSLIVTALAPLIALVGFALLGMWSLQGTAWVALFALIAVTSAAASTSHLWLIAILLRYPRSAWTVDDEHGMRILLPIENH